MSVVCGRGRHTEEPGWVSCSDRIVSEVSWPEGHAELPSMRLAEFSVDDIELATHDREGGQLWHGYFYPAA